MSTLADSLVMPGSAPSAGNDAIEQPGEAVKMDKLPQSSASASAAPADVTSNDGQPAAAPAAAADAPQEQSLPKTDGDAASADGPLSSTSSAPKAEASRPSVPAKADTEDSIAIGPAVDGMKPTTPGAPDQGPVCNITLLHATGGGRHPYKIDARYLARRNVTVPDTLPSGQPDPFSISIYTLKELILREWRSDWEGKPASPGSIRLIHFGKLLDDKEPLKSYQFSTESPNVVHMSVRPADLDEEEPKSSSKAAGGPGSDGRRSRAGGGCCVIL